MRSSAFARWVVRVDKQRPEISRTSRVCPYYRLPQLVPGSTRQLENRPMCAALDEPMPLSDQVASNLCRSGKFPTCERFQSVDPNWQPPESPTVETGIPGGRQLLSSLAWVIGIPTAITFLIVLAIWITENVWVPTQSALPVIFY